MFIKSYINSLCYVMFYFDFTLKKLNIRLSLSFYFFYFQEVKAYPFEMTFWERNAPSVPGFYKLMCGLGVAAGAGAGAVIYAKPKL